MAATVFNIQKFSIHDGPGIRTVVFFKGCPLCCLWCSNPESQNRHRQILWDAEKCTHCLRCEHSCPTASISFHDTHLAFEHRTCSECLICTHRCPTGALEFSGKETTVAEIMEAVKKDRDFYEESGGGVTLSGGEVLIWHDFACELLANLKKEQIHAALETTGFASPHIFQEVAGYADLLLFDIKHHDDARHVRYTGVSTELILQNLEWAAKKEIPVVARIPVIPAVNASPEDAVCFCELLKKFGITKVNLLPFHQFGQRKYDLLQKDYPLRNATALHPEDLIDYQQIFSSRGFDVSI